MELRQSSRLSIFPLAGALLLPRSYLPLHIFEPRYRAMVSDSIARDRRIAMIQPRPAPAAEGAAPALFEIGCVGRIAQIEAMDDGRYNLLLEGVRRFRMLNEMTVATPFRQVEAAFDGFDEDDEESAAPLPAVMRAEIEHQARAFAEAMGYAIDWDQVGRLDDEALVNGFAQAVPFDVATKQALLEAPTLGARADLLADCFRMGAGGGQTLQ